MSKSRLHKFEFKNDQKPQRVFLSSQNGLYTYSDLDRFSAFIKDKIEEKAGSLNVPVAFVSKSSDQLVFSIAACWRLGVPFIPINPKSTDKELNNYLKILEPSLIFCDNENRNRIDGDHVAKMDENFFLNSFTHDIRNMELPDSEKISADSIFGYFFTSGTTDHPKIVPLKRRQMISAANASAANFKPDKNHFLAALSSLNHVGGISIILRSVIYGTSIYRMSEFHEDMIKEFLGENTRFQAASLVPTMLSRLLEDPMFKTHHSFKSILLGGGPVQKKLLKNSIERGIPIVSSYGMTETCAQIVSNPLLAPSGTYTPLNSVGKPLPPNKMQIRDEKGKILGKNQSGALWLKGPQVFDGYFDPDDNTGKFDDDRWFNTGDFGHLNGFGQLFIESRRTDLIISGGENVNPTEVEEAILNIPFINEAVVIGLPDEEWGQKVTALITVDNGFKPELDDIRVELKEHLSDFKLPKELKIIDEFPKTQLGKIKRNELIKMLH